MGFYILSILVIWLLTTFIASQELSQVSQPTSFIADTNVFKNFSNQTISQEENIILEAIMEYIIILRCEDTEPVKWICHKYDMSQESTYIPQNKENTFGITLKILGYNSYKENACFCFKNSTVGEGIMENGLVTSVFIYDVDANHTVAKGGDFQLKCIYKTENELAHQAVFNATWILPEGVQWNKSRMSATTFSDSLKTLTIENANANDSGDYTCQISYNLENDEPETIMQINSTYSMAVMNLDEYFDLVNVFYSGNFYIRAHAVINMGVFYYNSIADIPKWLNPNGTQITNNEKFYISNRKYGSDDIYDSFLRITNVRLWDTGTYVARVFQFFNPGQVKFNLIIADAPIVYMEDVLMLAHEKAYIQCKVKSYPKALVTWTFEPCISWHKCSSQPKDIFNNITSSHGASPIEYIYNLTFKANSSGIIRCKAVNTDGTAIGESQIIIRDTNDNMTIFVATDKNKIELGDRVAITCIVFAYYFSDDIKWYDANRQLINETENILLQNSLIYYFYTVTLTFKKIAKSDQGQYECRARLRNSENTSSLYKVIILDGIFDLNVKWFVGLSIVLVISISLVIYLYIRSKRERKLLYELKAAGLANFEEGAVGEINPAMTLDEKADLLPYDCRFEFPRDKLKMGMQLGAGAFGTVFKAFAQGIKPNEKESVVAVKMVKRNANNEVIKALVSELKIMIHLGRHLNIVNLLGAVTKNIAKRELMVIVEYCHYGNIRNFLIDNRKGFINQINPNTGKIDNSIQIQNCEDNFDSHGNSGYLNTSDLDETQDDNDIRLSDNYMQQDYLYVISITTTDLVSWTFQLASGMEYLSSMNILHGDLAARNILLCKDYIVKICDFGLARSMYQLEDYKKQGDAMLPIKWLALESLSDHIFSTYTDVWSFGIVMWELFSLATIPYPDIYSYKNLYALLKNGYRMEKPKYANEDIYYLMLDCWNTNPKNRPLFNVLKEKLADMLEKEVVNHYLFLNEPYLKENADNRSLQEYFSLMGSPDEMAPQPPRYVNFHSKLEKCISPNDDNLIPLSSYNIPKDLST